MKKLGELFQGFRFTDVVDSGRPYTHDGPTDLYTDADLLGYIATNVEQYPEIRICDIGDNCVMHIIEQSLVFPVPDHSKGKTNKWDPVKKSFAIVN